jgi:hypothetical protein
VIFGGLPRTCTLNVIFGPLDVNGRGSRAGCLGVRRRYVSSLIVEATLIVHFVDQLSLEWFLVIGAVGRRRRQ